MGVTGLWPILQPCARPTPLPTLNRKRLAVDASIWIYQFLKAVRDKEGNALRNSHVVGFFRRICKLLFFGIKPVFVFDGGAPVLKRQTILSRKRRREGRRDDAVRTAGKLLAVQMQRRNEEEAEKRKKEKERERDGLRSLANDEEGLKEGEEIMYADEMGMSAQQRSQSRKFRKADAYHLPDLSNSIEGMGQPNDPRIMSAQELEDYARQFHNGEDVNLYDFSKIDFNGEFFSSLPPVDRYNILNAARLRSRLRMGLSKEQLEEMFPDRMAFSKFQIERVRERNELTQRLMNLNGMNDANSLFGVGTQRIAGERDREYVLVKNDGVEGGWALGVVSTDKSVGERNKPIDVDALHQKAEENDISETEDEFEDIPVEGLNRLPKLSATQRQNLTYQDYQSQELADQRRKLYSLRNGGTPQPVIAQSADPDTLFVDQAGLSDSGNGLFNEEEEDVNRAISLSFGKNVPPDEDLSETEHLNRAIALSLQSNYRVDSDADDDIEFEDVPMPKHKQVAVQAPKPISNTSGQMLAHIVNNRAYASVPKGKAVGLDSDSDSDVDMQASLAKARRQKALAPHRQPMPVISNTKNPFDGPLPFEKLDFKGSIFGSKAKVAPQSEHRSSDGLAEEDEDAGGFEKEDKVKPLPPWLVGAGDIRSDVEQQSRRGQEIDEEDKERRQEEERIFKQNNAPIEIQSSDEDGSDVEIVDPPPPRVKIFEGEGHKEAADVIGAELLVTSHVVDRETLPPQKSLVEISAGIEAQPGDDEQVDWSESDYEDTTSKPRHPHQPRETSSKLRSSSPEFEDVQVSNKNASQNEVPKEAKSPSPEFEDVNVGLPQSLTIAPIPQAQDTFENAPEEHYSDSFDEFSDPDDEELLTQLALEAESHAAFASTLNSKTPAENRLAYEAELKSLRTQQKKERRDADEVTMTMVSECQALLGLFGLPYITAPMEAEAQCAELVRLGLVDGVVTDDCDIFLFGGTRVYKNMFNSNKFVECYLQNDIEKEISLGRDQLIAIAQLLGSDYTEGLPGVGPVTAVEILSEFPTPNTGLEDFREWWRTIQTPHPPPASGEPSAFRKKFRRQQGTKLFLPPGFPSPAVTEAYLHPEVDSSPQPFQWGVPDLDRLRDFLMATIGWSQDRTDEVLVPVIRDMNRREAEGTQSNITRYFEGGVGAGAKPITAAQEAREGGSKRMKEAVNKLKGKKKAGNLEEMGTMADKGREWVKRNELVYDESKEREKAERRKKAKSKKKIRPAPLDHDGEVEDEGEVDGNEEDESSAEADDESGSASEDEYQTSLSKQGKRKEKPKAPARQPSRKKVKI